MVTEAVSVRRLYQELADRIAEMIARGEFAVGSKLPPERDLAQQFSVSRPTVREALIALEIAGVVGVRTGSGATVMRLPTLRENGHSKGVSDAGPSAFELVTARLVVEPAIAAQAALAATKEDLAEIAKALELFERNWKGTHWEKLDADRQFHIAVAAATHNPVLLQISEDLWEDMFGRIFAVLSERTQLTNRQEMTMNDHRVIFTCIERRDALGAQAAMRTHLLHVNLTLEPEAGGPARHRKPAAGRARRTGAGKP